METRKKRITGADAERIAKAIECLKALYEKTRKYESTKAYLENCTNRLQVIRVWYAGNKGYMEKSKIKFPYGTKVLKDTFGEAKQIYAYARKIKKLGIGKNELAENDPSTELWKPIETVFDLAIERAEWLEEV